jgi:hypothetical protein
MVANVNVRNFNVPLQNGGVAIFPVPMTPADHTLLTAILSELEAIHVRVLPSECPEVTGENSGG